MPGEPLMCIWQAVCCRENSSGTAVTVDSLKPVLQNLKDINNIRYLESKFTEVFKKPQVKFSDFLVYVNNYLRAPGVPLPLIIDDIESKCWSMIENAYHSETLTKQDLCKMWKIFNRLCVDDSYPPLMCKQQTDYLFQKIAQNINQAWETSASIPGDGLTFEQMIEELTCTYFNATSDMLVHKCIEDIHSWLVREIMKTGFLHKRTHKGANWTGWEKRWFVLSPGRLEYYHPVKQQKLKGEFLIDTKSEVTAMTDYKAVLKKNLGNRFKLTNIPSLTIEMCAKSEEEKLDWIKILQHNITSMAKGVTPQMQLLKKQQKYNKEGCRESLLKTEMELEAYELVARSVSIRVSPDKLKTDGLDTEMCEGLDGEAYDEEVFTVEKDQLKAVFLAIDQDGNGKIDRPEFLAFITNLGPHLDQREANIIFDIIDKDKREYILFEDFLEYFTAFVLGKSTDNNTEAKLRAAFLKADQDRTGVINFSEFSKYALSMRRSVTIEKVMAIFDQMDVKGKGVIEFQEFRKFFQHDNFFREKNASIRDSRNIEGYLKVVYEEADEAKLMSYLTDRWNKFTSFKRPGVTGDPVMTGAHGMVIDVVPGKYNLLDLACFNDLPPIKPKNIAVKVKWIPRASSDSFGRVIFPDDFDGILPIEIATNEHLAYYGCSLADGNQLQVSLLYRHCIQDFTYENNYLQDYVTADKAMGGSCIERHDFAHLDCPLDESSGFFVIGKFEDDLLHLTGFKVLTRHTLYVPSGVIHCNDYLKGTWRTMLSDEADIDQVQLVKIRNQENGEDVQHFTFTFKQVEF